MRLVALIEAALSHDSPRSLHRSPRAPMSTSDGPVLWDSKNRPPPSVSPRGSLVETDTLNTLVSGAIWRAEQLEVHGIRPTSQAWAEVSSLEEELAKALRVSEAEGRIARRGAVRAALKAGDYTRAHTLAEGYLADETAPKSLKIALREILEGDAQAMASRFRYASKHHSWREAQDLARRFREAGAFGLAA